MSDRKPRAAESGDDFPTAHPSGSRVWCVVDRVEPFGIHVHLEEDPAARGFIHRKDWSWSRHQSDLRNSVRPGERLQAVVLRRSGRELALSRRDARPDPYPEYREQHRPGESVVGRVKLMSPKGAGVLVSLQEGVDGFIPRSEIPEPYASEEGFGLLAGDAIAARIVRFGREDVTLSVTAHQRAVAAADDEAASREWSALRAHPAVGATLAGLYWNLKLSRLETPQVTEAIRRRIHRVLIVEDNGRVSKSLAMVFRHFGLPVDTAKSVPEATELLASARYDLLVLDLNLPVEHGVKLMRELSEPAPLVYVLTATEQAVEELLQEPVAAPSGATRRGPFFFRKPADPTALLRHLDAELTSPGSATDHRSPPTVMTAGAPANEMPRWPQTAGHQDFVQRIEEELAYLTRDTGAEQAFVLSYQPGPIFETVAGHPAPLSRQAQQELDLSPIGNLIRRRDYLFASDVSAEQEWFQHLVTVFPMSSFAGLGLDYSDQSEYGLFLVARTAGRMQAVAEPRLRLAALKIGNLLAQRRFDAVLTEKQGLLLTGLLADSLLHEIKNELQALDDYATLPVALIKEQGGNLAGLSPEQVNELKESVVGVQDVSRQLKGLVALFRNLAGRSRLALVDVNTTIERLAKTLRPFVEEHGAVVTTDLDPELPDVEIDPKLLEQPLLNLMINALEQMALAGASRRRLRVTTRHCPDSDLPVEIRVADSGHGIHEVHREKIFDLFFSTKPDGTGLGLYIARYFIARLGGRLRLADSFLFAGSEFTIELPREVPQ